MKTAGSLHVLGGLLASLVLAACNVVGSSGQVDGWSIGNEVACAASDEKCQQMITVATQRLDERDTGHSPVAQVSLHEEGLYPNDDGSMGQVFRSGGFPKVVVFVLADGSRRAIGVKYVLDMAVPTTYDHGPERTGGKGNRGPAETI